jgi:hypothetical protein
LAIVPIWRWVEQENSKRPKAKSQRQDDIRRKLQATGHPLLNTGEDTIEKERLMNGNLLLMLKIKYYNDRQ